MEYLFLKHGPLACACALYDGHDIGVDVSLRTISTDLLYRRRRFIDRQHGARGHYVKKTEPVTKKSFIHLLGPFHGA